MTSLPIWQPALDRLLLAPSLQAPQARFLFGALGEPREALLAALLERLQDPDASRARDAAFLMEHVCGAQDKDAVARFVASKAPIAVRAQARAYFQNGILNGRLNDEQATLPVPAGEELAFHVEDAARQVKRIPSPWQRARVAAETMVGDAPFADGEAATLVAMLATRLHVDPAAIHAELLVHPLTRPVVRAAALLFLRTLSQIAATMLEHAAAHLLPGELHDVAVREAARHRKDGPVTWHACVSAAQTAGVISVLIWEDGPLPRAWGGPVAADAGSAQFGLGEGPNAEHVMARAWRLSEEAGGMHVVTVQAALNCVLSAAPWLATKPKKPDAQVQAGVTAFANIQELTGKTAAAAPLAAPTQFNVELLKHTLANEVELVPQDLGDAARKDMGREMRLYGKTRDATLEQIAKDVAKKSAVTLRLARGFEHASRLAGFLSDEAAAGGLSATAAALRQAGSAEQHNVMSAVLKKTLAGTPAPSPNPTSRDEMRDQCLDGEPAGRDVLAMDLAAAALDVALQNSKCIDGLSDDDVAMLFSAAGKKAVAALLGKDAVGPEDVRLREAARLALLEEAPDLPSRQRRELTEVWLKGWTTLLTAACRGTCKQQCLENPDAPRFMAGYSLDHPSLNKAWP